MNLNRRFFAGIKKLAWAQNVTLGAWRGCIPQIERRNWERVRSGKGHRVSDGKMHLNV